MTSKRAKFPCEAIQIPCKIDRGAVSDNRERRESPIATTYGLRVAEAAGDIPVIVGGPDRCSRYKMIYRTLGVAGQEDLHSGKEIVEDASLQYARDRGVCYNGVSRDVRQEKEQGWDFYSCPKIPTSISISSYPSLPI